MRSTCKSPRSAHTYSTNLCRRSATSQTCLRSTSSSCSRSTAGGVQPCSSRPYPTGRARWTSGSDGLVPRPSEPRISTRCSAFGPQRKPSPAQQSGRGGSGRRSQYDLSACSLAKALSVLEQLVAEVVRYRCPPHEYYICNVSQRPTQQKSTSNGGGLSEVPSLIHNGVLMYMRTVTEPRGTLPSVCAPAGLRRPCAHTSDSRIPIRHHLSNPQKSSIPLQTTPRRCIGTIDTFMLIHTTRKQHSREDKTIQYRPGLN